MSEILYKRDLFQRIVYWKCDVVESHLKKGAYILRYEHGILNTENPSFSYSDIILGKNIGKKNQTTSLEQANKERDSIYERQKKKGYKSIRQLNTTADPIVLIEHESYKGELLYNLLNIHLPKYNTDVNNCIKPMKCQKFQLGKFEYAAIAQPKINGVRCVIMYEEHNSVDLFSEVYNVSIKSKEGLEYEINHIKEIFNKFYIKYPDYRNIVFDGEIYIKDKNVTTIGGAARNPKNIDHNNLQFVCFDLAIEDISNKERDDIRNNIAKMIKTISKDIFIQSNIKEHIQYNNYKVVFLNSNIVFDDTEAVQYMTDCINAGYEGCVIRDFNAVYKFGSRPMTMMKLKKFQDSEFRILDVELIGNPEDRVGFTICYTLKNDINDLVFNCNGTGTVEEKLSIYNSNPRGKLATVKFYERTKNGLPFHANVIAIRDYE